MKTLRYYGQEDLRYEEVPEPTPGPEQAKVRVQRAGICGTDLHEYKNRPCWLSHQPNPMTGRCMPVTIGHEFTGDVF